MLRSSQILFCVLLSFSSLFANSCLDHKPSGSSDEGEPTAPIGDQRNDVIADVKAILTEAGDCKHGTGYCATQDAVWRPSDYDWIENGPRVLIVDNPMPSAFILGRYKKRVAAILSMDHTGTYSSSQEFRKTAIPGGYLKIADLTGQSEPYFSAQFLQNELQSAIADAFSDVLERLDVGHATAAASIIGEYVPSASLVFAYAPIPPTDKLCSKDFVFIDSFYRNAGRTLADHSRDLKITVTNISGGLSKTDFVPWFRHTCTGASLSMAEFKRILQAERTFYAELDKVEMLTVQAGLSVHAAETDEYPNDCDGSLMQRRLRASFTFKSENYVVPQNGVALDQAPKGSFSAYTPLLSHCIDAYVVATRGTSDPHGLHWSADGFGWESIPLMYPSWIAPALTAHIASQDGLNERAALEQKEQFLRGSARVVIDPLHHRQFEAYKTGVLK